MQTGLGSDLRRLYYNYLRSCAEVVKPGGRCVTMVLRAMLFIDVARALGEWAVVSVQVMRTRANLPAAVTLVRQEEDTLKESLYAQLEALNHLVKVGLRGVFLSVYMYILSYGACSQSALTRPPLPTFV